MADEDIAKKMSEVDKSLEELKQKIDDNAEQMKDAGSDFSAYASQIKSVQRDIIKALETFKSPLLKSGATIASTLSFAVLENRYERQRLEKIKERAQTEKERNNLLKTQVSDLKKRKEKLDTGADAAERLRSKLSNKDLDPKEQKEIADTLKEYDSKVKNVTSQLNNTESEIKKSDDELKEFGNQSKSIAMGMRLKLATAISATADALNGLISSIRETQQKFGIAASVAAKLQFSNLIESVKSFLSTKTFVSAKDIEAAQSAFQEEFGGILTAEAGKELAQKAKDLGVSAETLAKARRTFLTSAMGNMNSAIAAEKTTLAAFEQQGMTNKEAYQLIARYSELYARNGDRFAQSFIRAAAEAKKIGVDLSKVDQVGDNIIDNFEGFLESQAELGAMGFGFDTSRLAELAETGDTGALFTELRSQLAATGKDITKLRRSERLALESAFGINISELQRMAGATPGLGGGEKTLSPEELQVKSNSLLEQLIKIGERLIPILGVIAAALTARAALGAMGIGGGSFGTAGRVALGIGGAAGLGATSYAGYSLAKEGNTTAGYLTGIGGGLATGAMIGSAVPIIGTAVGAILGGIIGGVSTYMGQRAAQQNTEQVEVDDFISTPGYGKRTLVTPGATIALNNNDNIIAYANDLMSYGDGMYAYPKGMLTSNKSTPMNDAYINRMEAKLDQVVRAIGSMQVKMDGKEVGKVLVDSSERVMVRGNQRLTGTSI